MDIYDKQQKHFQGVAAYVIMEGTKITGRVQFHTTKSGKVYCYLHFFGTTMVRGSASGYGYDKHSAAFEDAVDTLLVPPLPDGPLAYHAAEVQATAAGLAAWMRNHDGADWDDSLWAYNYTVVRAV